MSNSKTGFQVERIAFFSDAVFAIAITLMIIEVKPPHLHEHILLKEAIAALAEKTPMLAGVILSFIFIGVFWVRHHQVMKHVENYTPKLIRLNMAFLLTIVFLPFSTAFVFENTHSQSPVPMVFYNFNYILAAYFNYRVFSYILDKRNGIIAPTDTANMSEYRLELLYPVAVYTLVLIVSMFSVSAAPLFYAAFAFQSLFNRKRKPVMGKA